MVLDPRRLRVLREVALRGTITAAADALGYTPSAISQQLAALERESETRLVERAGRGVRLTDAGALLVERTEPVLKALEEAEAALERWRTAVAGDLRVAASGSVARALVIPVAAELAREHPDLRVTVRESEPAASVVALRLGELDVAVAHEYDHDALPATPELARVDLFAEEMLLAAPRGRFRPARAAPPASGASLASDAPPANAAPPASGPSHATDAPPIALADLAAETWAAEPPGASCGRALRGACRAAGFEPDVRYVSSENGVILAAVAGAGAVTLLPALGLAEPRPDVDVIRLAGTAPRRSVFALHRPGDPVRPSVALFVERLQR